MDLQRAIRALGGIKHVARSELLAEEMQRLPTQLGRTIQRAWRQQHLLEFNQVLQDAPVTIPGDPARIAQVAAITFAETRRVLTAPTPANGVDPLRTYVGLPDSQVSYIK